MKGDHHSPSHSLSNGHPFVKSINGHSASKPETNGSSRGHSNGVSAIRNSHPPVWEGHSREEVTRILLQGLNDLGYTAAANKLSEESGFALEEGTVADLRRDVLEGNWADAESLLFGDDLLESILAATSHGPGVAITSNGNSYVSPTKPSRRRRGLKLIEGADPLEMLFWMRQQKYLELLEKRSLEPALLALRADLTPLRQDGDTEPLHILGLLLMCSTPDELRKQANWDGAEGQSRRRLLSALSHYISPSVMIPEQRLARLLDQTKEHWINECRYHNTHTSPSLFHDHSCDRGDLPFNRFKSLEDHSNEVWYLAFSNNGKLLATASADKSVIVYDVEDNFRKKCTFSDHGSGICYLAWSPNDVNLITCTKEQDNMVRVYDVEVCQCTFFISSTNKNSSKNLHTSLIYLKHHQLPQPGLQTRNL